MSEAVDPAASKIEIVDRDGRDHGTDAAFSKDDDASVLARSASLPGNGTYLVLWTAYWPSDGHITHGGFGFVVGNATEPAPVVEQGGELSPVSAILLAGAFVALALTIGPLAFVLLAAGAPRGAPVAWRRAALLAASAAAFGAAVTGANIVHHLSLTGASATTLLADIHSGRMLAARLAFFLATALLATRAVRRPLVVIPATLAATLIALTFSFASHAYATGNGLLVAADLVHVLAASLWAGGVVTLALVLPHLPADGRAALRFSGLALASVAVVVLSGTLAGWVHVQTLERLLGTLYGRILMIKVALVGGMVALGGLNRLLFVPRAGDLAIRPRFRRVLAVEVAAGLLVLGVAGALATTDPNPAPPPPAAAFAATLPGENLENRIRVTLTLEPAVVGLNEATVNAAHAENGTAVATIKRVQLFLNRPDRSLPTQTVDLDSRGPGLYSGNVTFARAGLWKVTTAIQRTDAFDDAATFQLDIR